MLATLEPTQEEIEQTYWEDIQDDITFGDHHYIPKTEEKMVSLYASPKNNKKRKQVLQAEPTLTKEPPI